MVVTQEQIAEQNALLTIKLTKDDYGPKVDEAIKDLKKKVQIKGFRPGKVPTGMVRNMFGAQVLVEELNKLVSESLLGHLKEKEMDLLGDPIAQDERKAEYNIKSDSDYDFVYEIGIAPKFEISALSSDFKVARNKVTVDNSVVEEEIDRMRKRYGTVNNPDDDAALDKEDMLLLTLTELGDGDEAKENGVVANTPIVPSQVKDEALQTQILSCKKGDMFTIENIYKLLDRDKNAIEKHFLNLPDGAPDGMNTRFSAQIDNVSRVVPAELNQAFFDKIYGEGMVTSEDDLRDKIAKEVSQYYESESEKLVKNDITERLLEATEIPLPDIFLRKWLKATKSDEESGNEMTDEEIEDSFDDFARGLRWSLIYKKIAKDNGLKADEEEVKERIRELLVSRIGSQPDPLYLEQLIQHTMNNKEQVNQLLDEIVSKKVWDYIDGQITIEEKEVTSEAFWEIVKEQNEKASKK